MASCRMGESSGRQARACRSAWIRSGRACRRTGNSSSPPITRIEAPVCGSQRDRTNVGGYSLSVIDVQTMTVVSQINTAGRLFHGLQVTGSGPYMVWASGGGDNSIKKFTVSTAGDDHAGRQHCHPPDHPVDCRLCVELQARHPVQYGGCRGATGLPCRPGSIARPGPPSRFRPAPLSVPTGSFSTLPATATTAWPSSTSATVRGRKAAAGRLLPL